MILGIVGGVVGTWFGAFALIILVMQGETDVRWLLPVSLFAAAGIAGIAGAALARSHPQPSWIVLGVARVVLLVVLSTSFAGLHAPWLSLLVSLFGIMLIAAAALEYVNRKGTRN